MTWFYSQKTGILKHDDMDVTAGYSGYGPWKNVPDAQSRHGQGPLPRGQYRLETPIEQHPTVGHYAIPLSPDMNNQMFGRSAFYVHGDSYEHPGEASEGCIVVGLDARLRMWSSGDHDLEVTA
jgi:hypothetical protein